MWTDMWSSSDKQEDEKMQGGRMMDNRNPREHASRKGGDGEVDRAVRFSLKESIRTEEEAILTEIPRNARALMFTLKWVDFVLKRVPRKRVSDLLRMYTDIGWISEYARYQLMGYFRASLPDKDYEELEPLEEDMNSDVILSENSVSDDFRMTASDHIRSLLFILAIKGLRVEPKLVGTVEEEVKAIHEAEET